MNFKLKMYIAFILAMIFSASAWAENATVVFNPLAPFVEVFSGMFSRAWDIILTILKWAFIGLLAVIALGALGALLSLLGGEKLRAAVKAHQKEKKTRKKSAETFHRRRRESFQGGAAYGENDDEPTADPIEDSADAFYLRQFLLTQDESRFYKQLRIAAGKYFLVHAKVRVEDVISVRKGLPTKEWMRARGYVKSRHFDFVLITAAGEIFCAIELDDSTHDRPDRQRVDEIKNELAAAVGLKLLRFESGRDYSPDVIASQIAEN